MRPQRICIEDFMSHRYTEFDCSELRSILVVAREFNDPRRSNQVGKSNIFKALEYCLFGVTTLKQLDKIVRRGCDRCKVTVEFETQGLCYRVIRSRFKKTNKSELRLFQKNQNDWSDLTQKTATETEQVLQTIIKITPVSWRTAILFAQADLYGLASVTPREKKSILKEALQLSQYVGFEKIAKEKASLISKELEKTKASFEYLGDPLKDIEEITLLLEGSALRLKKEEELRDQYQKELAAKSIALEAIKGDDVGKCVLELHAIKLQLQQTRKKKASSERMLALNVEKVKSVDIEKAKNAADEAIASKEKLLASPVRDITIVKDEISKISNKEINGKAYIAKLQDDESRLNRSIPEGDSCQYCLQPVTKEHRAACEANRVKELAEVRLNLEKYKPLLSSLQKKRQALETEINQIQHYKNSLLLLDNKITSKKTEIAQIKILLQQVSESNSILVQEIEDAKIIENSLSEKESTLQKKIDSTQDPDDRRKVIESLTEDINQTSSNLKNSIDAIAYINGEIGGLNSRLKTRTADKDKLDNIKQDLRDKEKEYQLRFKVQQAFSSSGIPTMIINTVLDDLQIVTNDLLSKIRPGLEVAFDIAKTRGDGKQEDTLDIRYIRDGEEDEYEQLSGAQKVVVSLCLKMALSRIIQHRIGVDIKFLILDEVDAQFDDWSREAFVDIVKKWSEDLMIFVVTHSNHLKDKFSHAILVEEDGNGACGRLVTEW